jgi:hypothetical protein
LTSHTTPFVGFNAYLWVPIGIWALDRALRGARIVLLNVNFALGTKTPKKTTATYDEKSNVITLEMKMSSRLLKSRPGDYFFLYEPLSIRGYENHPMTAASYQQLLDGRGKNDDELYRTRSVSISSCVEDEEDATNSSPLLGATTPKDTTRAFSTMQYESRATFLIRPYDGWTRRLRDKCKASRNGRYHPWILAEGPYGHELPLHAYDTTLFIVGGTGISVPIPYLQQLANDGHGRKKTCDEEEGFAEGDPLTGLAQAPTRHMRLIWTAREPRFLRQVYTGYLEDSIASGHLQADLHCSSWAAGRQEAVVPPVGGSEYLAAEDDGSKDVQITGGRPDLDAMLGETVRNLAAQRLAVVVCGPTALTRSVKSAIRAAEKAQRSDVRIELFEEAFTW